MKFTRRAAAVGGLGLLASSSLSTSSLAEPLASTAKILSLKTRRI